MKRSESQLQKEVLAYCQGHPRVKRMFRVNSGKVKVKGGWMQLAPEGTPDLCGFSVDGLFIGIEMKDEAAWNSKNHGASEAQRGFLADIRACGGLCGIACSVAHAEAILNNTYIGLDDE